MVGKKLSHYKILGRLGAGGMGEVYRAEDTTLEREVALKVLPAEFASQPERLARFEREAKTLAALDHPNIVTIYTVEEAEGLHFLTMALVEGRTLGELIPPAGLALEQLLELAVPLADALRAAHEHGIVHRDLKPANVMVDGEGRLRVLDFGLAKLRPTEDEEETSRLPTEVMTRDGAILGTYPYMSPEQAEGKQIDERSDLFSLGVMLHEMATGLPPFRGETPASLIAAILTKTPPVVDEVREELPRHLGRIIRRCLEKAPEERYQRTTDLLHELKELERETASGVVAPSRPLAKRAVRLRRGLYAALGAIAVVAAAVGLYKQMVQEAPPAAVPAASIRSIAVLPLTNLMNDPEQDYFVDGMTEALIASLARIGDLKVISRTSAMRYKGTGKSAPEIARELDVDALLEGSVLRAGGQVRITAQLIDGRVDEHLWVETYDRSLTDILELHSDVARAVAGEIRLRLTPREQELLADIRSVHPEAYEAYLKGRYHLFQYSPAGVEKARDYFGQALELDPGSALGHAGMADLYFLVGLVGMAPATEVMPLAKSSALKALEIDESLAVGHSLLGWIKQNYDWDWPGAEREFVRAIELDPNDSGTHSSYSYHLAIFGRSDEALAEARRSRELDPLSPLANFGVAIQFYYARQYEEAVEQCRRALELNPRDPWAHRALGASLLMLRVEEQAIQELANAYSLFGNREVADALERGYAQGDTKSAFRQAAETMAAQFELTSAPPVDGGRRGAVRQGGRISDVATFYGLAGEIDLAIQWLESAFDMRDPFLVTIRIDPLFDPLRSDPQFEEMARRIGLPE